MRLMTDQSRSGHDADSAIPEGRREREDLGVAQGLEVEQHRRHPEQEAEVPDPIDEKSLQIGPDGGLSLIPEANQEIGDYPDRFPPEEKLQEVVRHAQHQHREGEQRDVAEEALIAGIVAHVADGVDVHHQRHEGHHEHHGRAQGVDEKSDFERQVPHLSPVIESALEYRCAVEDDVPKCGRRYESGRPDAEYAGPVGDRPSQGSFQRARQ